MANRCRSITREIKIDTTEIRQDTAAIKGDTIQILQEIARLRAQLPEDIHPESHQLLAADAPNFMLDRYLEQLTSYAETVCWSGNDSDTISEGSAEAGEPASLELLNSQRISESDKIREQGTPNLDGSREKPGSAPIPQIVSGDMSGGQKEDALLTSKLITMIEEMESYKIATTGEAKEGSSGAHIEHGRIHLQSQSRSELNGNEKGDDANEGTPKSPIDSPAQYRRRTTITTSTGTWEFGKTIGAGSVSKVKLAKNMETGELVS